MSEELVLRGLRDVVDAAKYPLLLVDLYGKHSIGVLIGCLRKLQRWNLTSVLRDDIPSLICLVCNRPRCFRTPLLLSSFS